MAGKGAGAADTKAGKGIAAGRRNMNATVTIYIVKTRPIEDRIVSSGTIMANEQVELKSEASGRIEKLNIKEGTPVKKGQLLVKINDSDLQAQLFKAKAAYNLAKDQENRQKRLLEREVISTEDYQTSLKELESGGADIELINAQIRKTEIRAPFDGIIGLRYVSEGAYVTSGTQIADLISLSPLKIEFSVPERYFGNVKPGTKLTFTIQASQKSYSAHVYAVEPKIDESTRTVLVRGFCENPDGNVAPGAFAKVELVLSTNNNAVVVPSEALVPDMVGQKVFRVSGGKALSSTVRTGIRTESMVEITQGLSAGDTIVTAGVLMLRPNMPVTISGTAE
jgi:membrane fusion protein (multidrug efflux system)